MNYGLRHGTVHKLTSGSSSSASSAFSANIEYIRVLGTVACHIHIAVSPTVLLTYLQAKLKLLKFQLEKKLQY